MAARDERTGEVKITKKDRETAADLCSLMASSSAASADPLDVIVIDRAQINFAEPCFALGVNCHSDFAAELARGAYWSVSNEHSVSEEQERQFWAEAEARLRTGWRPS